MMTRTILAVAATLLMLVAANSQAAGDVERGESLAYDCINCHGMQGEGNFETPAIAGLDEEYIIERLRGFCTGKLSSMDGIMNTYTEDLSDQDLQDLAAYWASLPKPAAQ
jgi:cytochrome c553